MYLVTPYVVLQAHPLPQEHGVLVGIDAAISMNARSIFPLNSQRG